MPIIIEKFDLVYVIDGKISTEVPLDNFWDTP
jgi:hypothetical protein